MGPLKSILGSREPWVGPYRKPAPISAPSFLSQRLFRSAAESYIRKLHTFLDESYIRKLHRKVTYESYIRKLHRKVIQLYKAKQTPKGLLKLSESYRLFWVGTHQRRFKRRKLQGYIFIPKSYFRLSTGLLWPHRGISNLLRRLRLPVSPHPIVSWFPLEILRHQVGCLV